MPGVSTIHIHTFMYIKISCVAGISPEVPVSDAGSHLGMNIHVVLVNIHVCMYVCMLCMYVCMWLFMQFMCGCTSYVVT